VEDWSVRVRRSDRTLTGSDPGLLAYCSATHRNVEGTPIMKISIWASRLRGHRRPLVLAAAIALAVSAMAVGPQREAEAAPAAVRITGVHRVSERTPFSGSNSSTLKTAVATCPGGERVLSGGAKVITANGSSTVGNVALTRLVPTTSTYGAQAVEAREGYSENWSLTAYAICVPDPQNNLGVEVVTRISAEDVKSDPFGLQVNDATAPCPSGKKIVGTGGELASIRSTNPAGTISFQQLRPNQQGAYAFVQGVMEANTIGPFFVTAHAVCAFPIQGWDVVIDGTDLNTDRLQIATAECEGQQLLGGGMTKGDLTGFGHVETMEPVHGTGTAFQRITVLAGVRGSFQVIDWNIAAWAICADF
jgi:hypothetical protein